MHHSVHYAKMAKFKALKKFCPPKDLKLSSPIPSKDLGIT
jgi:hypothetical protein